jgi:hypothetical protein
MAVAVVKGRIHTAGGEDLPANEVFDTHEAYDPVAQAWSTLTSLPQAAHGALGLALEEGFMVIGGSSRAGGQSLLGWLDRVHLFMVEAG